MHDIACHAGDRRSHRWPVDRDSQPFPQPPSPTHMQQPLPARPAYGHSRKDSETLRSFPASSSAPQLEQIPQGMPPPATSNSRYAGSAAVPSAVRARRTAPEPPSASAVSQGYEEPGQVRWAEPPVGEVPNGRERDAPKSRAPYTDQPPRTTSAPSVTQQQAAPAPASAPEPSQRTPTAPALAHFANGQRQLIVSLMSLARTARSSLTRVTR